MPLFQHPQHPKITAKKEGLLVLTRLEPASLIPDTPTTPHACTDYYARLLAWH